MWAEVLVLWGRGHCPPILAMRGQNRSCSPQFSNAVHFNTSILLKIIKICQDEAALKLQEIL